MGITFASSAGQEFAQSQHIGKAAAVGTLDTIKSIGPLEGATIGSMFGPVGTGVGFGIGLVNAGIQMYNPHFYSDLKKGVKEFIDDPVQTIKNIGKATVNTVNSIVGGASKVFSGIFGGT